MRLFHSFLLAGCIAGVAAGGCTDGMLGDNGEGAPTDGTSGKTPGNQGAAVGDGVPCDVGQVLAQNCTSCHAGATPKAGVDLTTYAALTAPSSANSAQSVIERSAIRMRDAQSPMPTTGMIADADIQIIEQWVAAGAPKASCATPTQPPTITVQCTSNKFSTSNHESSQMRPGNACISCHENPPNGGDFGPALKFGGTVYPTAHEPDDCVGQGGATIVITDANGAQYTATAGANGNFTQKGTPLAFPITAEIRANGKVLTMKTKVDSADCNSCHTVMGTSDAPGRIVAP